MFPRMHISLYVSNIGKTVEFYRQFFGVEPAKQKNEYAKFHLESPSLIISFVENPQKVNPAFGHLGFQLEKREEVMARLATSQELGIVSREEIGTACCYALQDKFWVEDPDGYQWEVYYFHKDVEFNDPHYATEEASACCTPQQKEKSRLALADLNSPSCEAGSGCC